MLWLLLLFSIFIQSIFCQPKLSADQVIMRSGSAFSQTVIPGDGERISACLLQFQNSKNETVQIGLQLEGIQKFGSDDFEKRLSNIGRNICGFSLHTFTTKDSNNYTIIVDYIKNNVTNSISLSFKANCYEYSDDSPLTNSTSFVLISESGSIGCSADSAPNVLRSDIFACRLYNPKGELVNQGMDDCSFSIPYISIEHIGTWKCSMSISYSTKALDRYITYILKDSPKVETWYKAEEVHAMIGCRYINDDMNYPLKSCQMVDPENNVYSVSDKRPATERYTFVGTDFDNHICQIEFPVPLLPSEKGIWKCIVGSTGGFINTDEVNTKIELKDQVQYGVLGEPLNIKCYFPISADSCIIVSPSGNIYFGGTPEDFQMGECGTTIDVLNATDVGTWSCRFSPKDSSAHELIKIEVISGEVGTGFSEIEVSSGGSAELKCKFGAPVPFCYYIDPQGNSYNISPKKKSGSIEYIGAGLEHGDCSVRINGVLKDQEGDWRCVSANARIAKVIELKTKVVVDQTFTANATSVGIFVGIMAVAAVLLAIGLITRFGKTKKKLRNSDASNSSLPIEIFSRTLYTENLDGSSMSQI